MDERAQVLLIGGFIVAFGLVVLTIMFNNIIYASNVASEAGVETSKPDIVNARKDLAREAWYAANQSKEAGQYNTTYIREYVSEYGNAARRHYATRGQSYSTSVSSVSSAPYYTREATMGGTQNWTIVSDVDDVNTFDIRFNRSSLVSATSATDAVDNGAFTITVYNDSGRMWWMVAWAHDSYINVYAWNSTGSTWSNSSLDESDVIDVLELGLEESADNYSIRFNNGSKATAPSSRPAGTHGYTISGEHVDGSEFSVTRDIRVDVTLHLGGGRVSYNASVAVGVPQ